MSNERDRYIFQFSQPFTIHDDSEILNQMGMNDPHYEMKLNGTTTNITNTTQIANPPTTTHSDPSRVVMPQPPVQPVIGLPNLVNTPGMPGMSPLGMMGLAPRLGIPPPGIPASPVMMPTTAPLPIALEQLQLAQLQQQQNFRQQQLLQQQLLQYQIQMQAVHQPPPVHFKAEPGEPQALVKAPVTLPPPPTIRNSQTK